MRITKIVRSQLACLVALLFSIQVAQGQIEKHVIAFDSSRIERGASNVYVIAPDGNGLRNVTAAAKGKKLTHARLPSWSSDHRRIVFEGYDMKNRMDIYIIDINGGNLKRLNCQLRTRSFQPMWSPDDKDILFRAQPAKGKGSALHVMDANGANVRQVGPLGSSWGSWSPDGKRIAFSSLTEKWKEGDPIELCVMNADGSGFRQLTNKQGQNEAADWSPDGRTLVFNSNRDGNDEIYSFDLETGRTRNLTNHKEADLRPAFSPDGKQIVFLSMRGRCLHVMDANGQNIRPLSAAVGNHADW